jgi:DNA repair protein RadC
MITLNNKPTARHFWKIEESNPVTTPKDVDNYIRNHIFNPFSDCEQEEMWVLLLNTRQQITHQGMISKGTVNFTIVYIRDLFREAIRNNASKIIMTHNHPSGNEEPSGEDIRMTEKVYEAGELLGVSVEDHLIIGRRSYTSMREVYGPTFR